MLELLKAVLSPGSKTPTERLSAYATARCINPNPVKLDTSSSIPCNPPILTILSFFQTPNSPSHNPTGRVQQSARLHLYDSPVTDYRRESLLIKPPGRRQAWTLKPLRCGLKSLHTVAAWLFSFICPFLSHLTSTPTTPGESLKHTLKRAAKPKISQLSVANRCINSKYPGKA